MADSFPSHFTNEHEILFYEGISNQNYQSKNGKAKSPLMMKNQEIQKENISSPEFSLFHMASPDLERLIVGQTSTSETPVTNSRETTTINTSDLNVLNLVSPDFEKIFSNFNDKESGQDKGRSVQKQHEVYTKTFVDALHKIQCEQQLGNKDGTHNIETSGTRLHENKIYNFDNQKHQFVRRKVRNEQQFMPGQDRGIEDMNLSNYGTFGLATMEDKNKNKIGTFEQQSFGSKAGNIGREDRNRNTIRTHYANHPAILNTYNAAINTQMEVGNRNTGFGNQNNGTIPGNQSNSHPSALAMGDGNRIQANYSNYGSSNPKQSNPNINPGNRTNPSEINLESHPELLKLHAHVKLSENMRDHMEQVPSGHQDVHTTQMFPLPPIDLQVQEVVKRERKKQKNRVAASKCRKKKLEREAQLEVKVQQLRERNIELTTIASALRSQLSDLKQHVMEHIACGCHVTAY